MKCSNCQQEFEGKFCPECGFPKDKARPKADEAFEMLKRIDERVAVLEIAEQKRIKVREDFDAKRKAEKDDKNKSGKTTSGKSRTFLDIF